MSASGIGDRAWADVNEVVGANPKRAAAINRFGVP